MGETGRSSFGRLALYQRGRQVKVRKCEDTLVYASTSKEYLHLKFRTDTVLRHTSIRENIKEILTLKVPNGYSVKKTLLPSPVKCTNFYSPRDELPKKPSVLRLHTDVSVYTNTLGSMIKISLYMMNSLNF